MGRSEKRKRSKVGIGNKTRVAGWEMGPQEAVRQIRAAGKKVLTFFGYSGMGYEDEGRMLELTGKVLSRFSHATTMVNIGATEDGLGKIYRLAKDRGFETSGIVSTCSLDYPGQFSRHVDTIYLIQDQCWGGLVEGTGRLSPTSEALVLATDYAVGIGGNEISRDELLAVRQLGRPVVFFPADMNHKKLKKRLGKHANPTPQDFQGAAYQAFLADRSQSAAAEAEN